MQPEDAELSAEELKGNPRVTEQPSREQTLSIGSATRHFMSGDYVKKSSPLLGLDFSTHYATFVTASLRRSGKQRALKFARQKDFGCCHLQSSKQSTLRPAQSAEQSPTDVSRSPLHLAMTHMNSQLDSIPTLLKG